MSHRLKEAYNAFASIAESAEGELSALRAQLEQKGAELAGLRAAVVCERSKAAADTTRLEEELSFLNQQLGERDAAISSLREQARRLNADYDNAKAAAAVNVAALSAEIMSLKSENTALRADVVSASAGVASAVERERAKSQEAQQAHMLVIAGIIKENEALKQ